MPTKGSKAKVKWGRNIFPATILEISSEKDVKKKEKDFHLQKANESTKMRMKVNQKEERLVEGKKAKHLQFTTSSPQLRSKFAATSLKVRKVGTLHANIYFVPTVVHSYLEKVYLFYMIIKILVLKLYQRVCLSIYIRH